MSAPDFPIDELLPRIRDSLRGHNRLVLEAPPGAGKTTRVPPALLDEPWLQGRRVVMLEPRRIAARAAARFMAAARGEDVGGTVGYRIRFENRVCADTRIEVVTEGILTRMLQDDPALDGVGAVLFDEFHERHLAGDLGLALALDVQAGLREDLRIVVMSATLDGARLAAQLDAPRLSSAGRSHPVEVAHFPARGDEPLQHQVGRAVMHALGSHPGDVLVFLPGRREIGLVARRLEAGLPGDAEVLPLHGDLPVAQQARVLQPATDGRRRVVLATNVAESSVTLPGVRVVIDSGLAREPRYDPNSGFSRLDRVAISQASADQRAGRAGRIAPGWAYRLWPQSQRLEPQRRPEIGQVELASLALELAAWGTQDLQFPDPPPAGALAAARDLLEQLGALQGGSITPRGRRMLALGTHPRLAAMLLAPEDAAELALACDLAAILESRNPLRDGSDDIAAHWRALAAHRQGRSGPATRAAFAAIDALAAQWRRRTGARQPPPGEAPAHLLGALLAHAFPGHVARQHPADPRRYQLASGRAARLAEDSALFGEPWLVATELRMPDGRDRGQALILRATALDEQRLEREWPERFTESDVVRWDAAQRRIVAARERRFAAIVLDSRPLPDPDRSRYGEALLDAVRQLGLEALPWTPTLHQWRARVRSLRAWLPGLELPDLSDAALLATLEQWLRPSLEGLARLDALSPAAFAAALQVNVDGSLRRRVDLLAPLRVPVPSGLERPVEYGFDDATGEPVEPVLAVKLQELFGMAETPRIAEGRVPLVLHLLSPGGRPLQVTRDLRGFWERTYPEVRREMKGRYPRHPWPEDPWTAQATHRAKPRAR